MRNCKNLGESRSGDIPFFHPTIGLRTQFGSTDRYDLQLPIPRPLRGPDVMPPRLQVIRRIHSPDISAPWLVPIQRASVPAFRVDHLLLRRRIVVVSKRLVDRRRLLCNDWGVIIQVVIGNTLGTWRGIFGNGEREGGKTRTDRMSDMIGEERSHNWKADAGWYLVSMRLQRGGKSKEFYQCRCLTRPQPTCRLEQLSLRTRISMWPKKNRI